MDIFNYVIYKKGIKMIVNKSRNSSIECLRIIAMLSIIICHFGVHGVFHITVDSVVPVEIFANNITYQQLITYPVSLGGTFGNSIFLLITGYFMINKAVNYKKIILLLFNMFFYSWLILLLVYIEYPNIVTPNKIIKHMLPVLFGENWFVSCYIYFSIFIPFLNKFLLGLEKKRYVMFMAVSFFLIILSHALNINTFSNAEIIFFGFTYALGAFLKLHCKCYFKEKNHKKYLSYFWYVLIMIFALEIIVESIGILIDNEIIIKKATVIISRVFGIPLAFIMFLTFATIKPFYNQYINVIAGTVLGIYLIHDNSLARYVIWDYILPNLDYIKSNWYVLFYVIKVLAVFIVCSSIDLLRKRYIEPPMARFIDRHFDAVSEYMKTKVNNVITSLTR